MVIPLVFHPFYYTQDTGYCISMFKTEYKNNISRKGTSMRKKFSLIIALTIYFLFYVFVALRFNSGKLNFEPFWQFRNVILEGWLNTILISTVAIVFSLIIGLMLYAMQASRFHILKYLAEIHKTIIFGTPLLALAIIAFYYIGFAFNVNSEIIVGSLTLSLYIGAYIADIYKGAIESIHINQWQSAKMFGFTKYQTYRYIIFPQVIKSILPPLAGQFAMTIKGSALLAYMSTNELLNAVSNIQANSFKITEGFIILILGYWIITVPLITLVRKLENKSNYRM